MKNPYIVSMLEQQFILEEHLKEIDKILEGTFSNEVYNHLILARSGITNNLAFLTKMIEKAHSEIDRGSLSDPSFNKLMEETE